MGTNYYHRKEPIIPCPTCGRHDEPTDFHIGKSSAGWQFTFHGTEAIRSYKDWLEILEASGEIFDEYGRKVELTEFKELVEKKRSEPFNHARDVNDPNHSQYSGWRNSHGDWTDSEGYSFSGGEFS